MEQLTPDVLKRIKSDEALQLSIATGMRKRIRTVREWIRSAEKGEPEENLTSQAAVLIISKATGLPEDKILKAIPASFTKGS